MKKVFFIIVIICGIASLSAFKSSESGYEINLEKSVVESKFNEGFKDGHCEGWKDEKGSMALCPISPLPPMPELGQSSNSYRDGYNTGFKRGIRDARK